MPNAKTIIDEIHVSRDQVHGWELLTLACNDSAPGFERGVVDP